MKAYRVQHLMNASQAYVTKENACIVPAIVDQAEIAQSVTTYLLTLVSLLEFAQQQKMVDFLEEPSRELLLEALPLLVLWLEVSSTAKKRIRTLPWIGMRSINEIYYIHFLT